MRMQGNLVLFKMSRVWNGLCCLRDSRVWRKIGELKVLKIGYRYICLHLKQCMFHFCHSWHHFVEGFLQSWCYKDSGANFVISAFSSFNAILETGTVYIMGAAVFWTWTSSVIVAKEVSTRLLLSLAFGTADNDIGGNFKLIPWYLFVLQNSYQSKYVKIFSN